MALALPAVDFAVRLADEGVPLRAIARATRVSSEDLREQLHQAQVNGLLVELPHDDWPPGFPRDQRSLQLSRLARENKLALYRTIGQIFQLTGTEVTLLMALIQHDMVSKLKSDMAPKTVDVHICNMRKRLALFGVRILTLRGYGYQLSVDDRRHIMDRIVARVAKMPTL